MQSMDDLDTVWRELLVGEVVPVASGARERADVHVRRRRRNRHVRAGSSACALIALVFLAGLATRGSAPTRVDVQDGPEPTASASSTTTGSSPTTNATNIGPTPLIEGESSTPPGRVPRTGDADDGSSVSPTPTAPSALPIGSTPAPTHPGSDPSTQQPVPTTQAPVVSPPDDGTPRLTVALRDEGMYAGYPNLQAGALDLTFIDERSDRSGANPALYGELLPASGIPAGTTSRVHLPGGDLWLTWKLGQQHSLETLSIDVDIPVLEPPSEPAAQLTLEVRDGEIRAPYRDVRTDPPRLKSDSSPYAQRWTTIAGGVMTVRLLNPDGGEHRVRIENLGEWKLGANDAELIVSVPFSDWDRTTYTAWCTNGDHAERGEEIFLWVTG